MKRLFLILLILISLMPVTFSYAAAKQNPKAKNVVVEKVQNTSVIKAELKLLQTQISSNKTNLVNMKKNANNSFNKAKTKLKQILKKKHNMTQEKIDLINEAIQSLQEDSKALSDTSEELNILYSNLQSANNATDYQLIKHVMNEIISLQKIRINHLQQAINDMDRIAKM